MKLFIVNKEAFDEAFPESQRFIHKKAYNYLLQSLAYDERAPSYIELTYEVFDVRFELVNEKSDVYFYEFKLL